LGNVGSPKAIISELYFDFSKAMHLAINPRRKK
jgi:hypothetical protein